MKKLLRFLKWIIITFIAILIVGILYIRFTRKVDKILYQGENFKPYEKFESQFKVKEEFVTVYNNIKLHTALFMPDSIEPIATIFYPEGKGGNLINAQNFFKPLIEKGFQIYSFEYRDIGLSTGKSENSLTLKNDVLFLFDRLYKNPSIQKKPIIVWGHSMGTAFATMVAKERQDKIKGLVLEGGFSSYPDIAKHYADFIHLEHFKWLIPLVMNNDFPAEEEITYIHKPTVIIHSTEDEAVPYELGQKLFNSSNKENTRFWKIKGRHVQGIKLYEKEYVKIFKNMINK